MAEIKLNEDEVFSVQKGENDKAYITGILDIPKMRENVRGRISLRIVTALLGIVFLAYAAFIVLSIRHTTPPTFSDLKDLTEVLIAPVVGIAGAVTGILLWLEAHGEVP